VIQRGVVVLPRLRDPLTDVLLVCPEAMLRVHEVVLRLAVIGHDVGVTHVMNPDTGVAHSLRINEERYAHG